jgi:hypothetical protein
VRAFLDARPEADEPAALTQRVAQGNAHAASCFHIHVCFSVLVAISQENCS